MGSISVSRRMAPSGSRLAWINPGATSWSHGVQELLGLPAAHLNASLDLFMSFVHPEDLFIRDFVSGSREPGRLDEVFFRVVRRDGEVHLLSLMALDSGSDDAPRRLALLDHSAAFRSPSERLGLIERLLGRQRLPTGLWWTAGRDDPLEMTPTARLVFDIGNDEEVTLGQLTRQFRPEDREGFAALGKTARGTDRGSETLRAGFLRALDGEIRWLDVSIAADRDERGVVLGLWGTVTDVTDELVREERVQTSEAVLAGCLGRINDGVLVLDRNGRIELANEAGRRIVGTTGDPGGKILWELCPALVGDRLWQLVQAAWDKGAASEEERLVAALGQWLSYSVSRLDRHVLVTFRSRDEVQRIKSMFAEVSERCGAAFRWGQVAIWEFDPASGKVWVADTRRGLVGSETSSLSSFRDRIVPDDRARLDDALRRSLMERTDFQVDFRIVEGEGRIAKKRVRGGWATGSLDAGGRLVGVALPIEDAPDRPGSAVVPLEPRTMSLTGAQVRAARGALRWSVRELAERSDVSIATINRFEAGSRSVNARDSSVSALRRVLLEEGITFFVTPDGQPAIAMPSDNPGASSDRMRPVEGVLSAST